MKRQLLAFVFLCCCLQGQAQISFTAKRVNDVVWRPIYPLLEQKMRLQQDGRLLLFYNFSDWIVSGGDTFRTAGGGQTAVLVTLTDTKRDAVRSTMLTFPAGGGGVAHAVAVGPQGNYYVTGKFSAAGRDSATLFYVFDSTGKFTSRMSAQGTIAGQGIAVDAEGNVYANGYFPDSLRVEGQTFRTVPDAHGMGFSSYLLKFGPDLHLRWAKHIQSQQPKMHGLHFMVHAHSILVTRRGMVHLSGHYTHNVGVDTFRRRAHADDNLASADQTDKFYVIGLDTAGTVKWLTAPRVTGERAGYFIVEDDSGYIYVSGPGRYAAKLHPLTGEPVFFQAKPGYNGSGFPVPDRSGKALLTDGYYLPLPYDTAPGAAYGLSQKIAYNNMISPAPGVFYLHADYDDSLRYGSLLLANPQAPSGYKHNALVRLELSPLTGVKERKSAGLNFQLFPNPASDHVQLRFGGTFSGKVEMYGLTGEMLAGERLRDVQGYVLSLAGLPSGAYLLRVIDEKGKGVQRVVVVRN